MYLVNEKKCYEDRMVELKKQKDQSLKQKEMAEKQTQNFMKSWEENMKKIREDFTY